MSVLIFDMISARPRFLSSLVLVYLVITKPCLSMKEFSVVNLGSFGALGKFYKSFLKKFRTSGSVAFTVSSCYLSAEYRAVS